MSGPLIVSVRNTEFEQKVAAIIAAKRSKHTQLAYQTDFDRWAHFCYSHGVDPASAPVNAVTAFRGVLLASMAQASARRSMAALSSIYSTLLKLGAVPANLFHPALVAWPVVSIAAKTARVEDAVADAMIARAQNAQPAAKAARDTAILRLLYDTGLRRSSVVSIRRQTIRQAGPKLEVRAVIKGGKEEPIELPAITTRAVLDWLALAPPSAFLFPGVKDRALHPNAVNKIVAEYARAVGAPEVHPHCFRAAFITEGFDLRLPENEISAAVHHTDRRTTMGYDRGARGARVAHEVAKARADRKASR